MRIPLHIGLLLILFLPAQAQEIKLRSKSDPSISRTISIEKEITVKTFERDRVRGMAGVDSMGNLNINGEKIDLDDIMMFSGFVLRNPREKAYGLGMTIAAGLVLPVSVYYILGGIAWGFGSGVFVGATLLAFDMILAYAGTNLMGIFPRRFSTMNWQVVPVPSDARQSFSIQKPVD